MHRLPRLALAAAAVALVMTGGGAGSPAPATAATVTVDEVTYAFGNERTEVVVSWRGAEPTLFWGADDNYGNQVTATRSMISPVDTSGAGDAFNAGYLEARLAGASEADAALAGHRTAVWTIMRRGAIPPASS